MTYSLQNTESLKKGWEFQQFVEKTFFPSPIYSIVSRTSSFMEPKTEQDSNPDYTIRAKYLDNEIFGVECKYRSKYALTNRILSHSQRNLFNSLRDNDKMKIFIILGLCGQPSNPDKIFILPFTDEVFKFPVFRLDYLMQFERQSKNYLIYDNGLLY